MILIYVLTIHDHWYIDIYSVVILCSIWVNVLWRCEVTVSNMLITHRYMNGWAIVMWGLDAYQKWYSDRFEYKLQAITVVVEMSKKRSYMEDRVTIC